MAKSIDPTVSSPALDSALAWLAQPPAEDPLRDLVPLRSHLAAVDEMGVAPLQLLRILELFQPRVNAVNAALKPLLNETVLPADRRLRTISQGLLDVHGGIAAAYDKVMREADSDRLQTLHRNPTSLCALAMGNLAQQMEVALLISSPPPPDMWRTAQAIYHWTMTATPHDATLPAGANAVLRLFKAMLALAAAQPESFTPAELDFLLDYLQEFSGQVEFADTLPASNETETWYWINDGRDQPPCAVVRRPPLAHGRNICFSCRELGRSALEHIEHLLAGEGAETIGLDEATTNPALRQALHRAASRWVAPPKRHMSRRGSNSRVQVCSDLAALWRHQRGDARPVADATGITATNWMMLNESPGGLAIMHVSGNTRGITAGSALAVQPAADQPWGLCLVRWVRSDNPEHLELGLELVAAAAEAVRLIRHNGGDQLTDEAAIEAFRLPPLAATKRAEALLAAPGIHQAGTFTLVSENKDRIQLTDCTPSTLLLQTASIELFEFTRDFSPSGR
ncbi:MAG: hypothetical protein KJ787_12275 [Gammaproteobacteria bacterium]|nr:hypothetical protein [Gammaproteobacteria bacterium]MBU1647100.1 hypothetical protein [Gammaproteobacteria bacterium]MBU1972612.1 hypothetical protein [Gammaproteobacteria bacterium]